MDSSMRELTGAFSEKSEEVSLLLSRVQTVSEIPLLSQGWFVPSGENLDVALIWSQQDLKKESTLRLLTYQKLLPSGSSPSPPATLRNELVWIQPTPDGLQTAQIIKHKEESSKDNSYHVEIWSCSRRTKTVDVTALDVHGDIYDNDVMFGSVSWSSCSTKLMYIAEKKKQKPRKFYEQKKQDDEGEDNPEKEKLRENHQHKTVFGETLGSKETPVPCVLDIKKETVTAIPLHRLVEAARCPVWAPGNGGIVYTGMIRCPYKLGLIYCHQRRSALFLYNLEKKTTVPLTPVEGRSVYSPRFSPDGKRLVYLDAQELGPHHKSARIMSMNWGTRKSTVCLDCPRRVTDIYAGMYVELTARCWADDSDRIIFSTHYKFEDYVYVLSTSTGKLRRLPFPEGHTGSMIVKDVCNDHILAVCSLIATEYFLVYGKLPPPGEEETIKWTKVQGSSMCDASLSIDVAIKVSTLKCVPDNHDYPDLSFECVLSAPKNRTKDCPLVIIPHGGPHSRSSMSFFPLSTILSHCGFAVAFVNYRGSLGYGEDFVNCLPGNVGDLDVKDVQHATQHLLDTEGFNPEKVCVVGGSHGGLLAGHLISQYPDTYKAACMRNPVINIATMIGMSDIPDWCYVECGEDFNFKQLPTADLLKKALNSSPISHVDNVKCPVLIQVGLGDKRVPPGQPREFYKALKARGKTVCMFDYEKDGHALASVGTFIHCVIYQLVFMTKHLDVSSKDLMSNRTPQD